MSDTAGRNGGGDSLLEFLRHHTPTMPEEVVRVAAWGGRAVVLRGMTAGERDRFEAEALRRGQEKALARGFNGGGEARAGFRQGRQATRREREARIAGSMDMEEFRARTIAATIWENGGRAFDNDEGRRLLSRQPIAVIMPLFEACQRLNGFTDEDVEELTGGTGFTASTPDGDSSSVSPSPSGEPLASSNGHSEQESSTSG